MNLLQANKIIAEYMGVKIQRYPDGEMENFVPCESCAGSDEYGTLYSRSLDALSKVWDKLGITKIKSVNSAIWDESKYYWQFIIGPNIDTIGEGETVQEAACISTAKAILELTK